MYIDDIDANVYLQQGEPITSGSSLTGESVAIGTSPQIRSQAQNQMIISLLHLYISSKRQISSYAQNQVRIYFFSMIENEEGN